MHPENLIIKGPIWLHSLLEIKTEMKNLMRLAHDQIQTLDQCIEMVEDTFTTFIDRYGE